MLPDFLCRRGNAMPKRPDTPCRYQDCLALVPYDQKYCGKQNALNPEDVRSAASRGYIVARRKGVKPFLHDVQPLYQGCPKEGRYTEATVRWLQQYGRKDGCRNAGLLNDQLTILKSQLES